MSDTPRTDRAANESIVAVYEESKRLERELAEAREQRDRLTKAIIKHKDTLPIKPDYCDYQLWEALAALTP